MEKYEKDLQENDDTIEKDSLMWNEEDYQVMEKITGFDEETIEKDQKKTLRIIVLTIILVVMLAIGILIGYNLPRRNDKEFVVTQRPLEEKEISIKSAYTRKNVSNELYLYLKDNNGEEYSVLDLSKYNNFEYNYYNNKLYVLLESDNLALLEITLNNSSYKSNKVENFNEHNDDRIFFADNLIYFVNDSRVLYYDVVSNQTNDLDFNLSDCYIVSINKNYIIYNKEGKTNLYSFLTGDSVLIADNVLLAEFEGEDKILYLVQDRSEKTVMLYEFNIDSQDKKFVTEIDIEVAQFINYKELYIYNDDNKVYLYDGIYNKKIYEIPTKISEMAYMNDEEIIFVSADYDSETCALSESKVGVFNLNTHKIKEKTISGCLDTLVINNVVYAK